MGGVAAPACAALTGAGTMYFLDPAHGRRRRALARDVSRKVVRGGRGAKRSPAQLDERAPAEFERHGSLTAVDAQGSEESAPSTVPDGRSWGEDAGAR
jgi:hypothetical protein